MRTRKMNNTRFSFKIDKFFWFFLGSFPLFGYCLYLFSINGTVAEVSFASFLTNFMQVSVYGSNPIHQVFVSIFGPSGLFPLFSASSGFMSFFSYVASVEVIHVCFDVVVFIPRLAHKWISKAVQDD